MTINGFIPIHKPVGLSSQQTVSKVKKILGSKKAGHTGTLDPAAEGLLLVAVGKATRLTEYFLNRDKGYRAEVHFGASTDTGDREGNIVEQKQNFSISRDRVLAALASFTGKIKQVPPAASALKIDGQPAYKLFRQGKAPEIPARDVTIYSLQPLGQVSTITPDRPLLHLDIHCSKGTYIRSLAADIGASLDCPAHLSSLLRTSIGQIDLSQAASLDDLEQGYQTWLLDMAIAVDHMPVVELDLRQAAAFCHGRRVESQGIDGETAVFQGNKLLGIAQVHSGIIKPVKVIQES